MAVVGCCLGPWRSRVIFYFELAVYHYKAYFRFRYVKKLKDDLICLTTQCVANYLVLFPLKNYIDLSYNDWRKAGKTGKSERSEYWNNCKAGTIGKLEQP
jgi:hypothetical protein